MNFLTMGPMQSAIPALLPDLAEDPVKEMGGEVVKPERPRGLNMGSPLRNILGRIGDALLVGSGNEPMYAPRLRQMQANEALQGYLKAPDDAIANYMNVDPAGAIQLYRQRQQDVAAQATQQREAAEREIATLAPLAARARQLPYEQRGAFLQQVAPDLARMGIDPQRIAGFDPSDTALDAIIARGQTVEQIQSRGQIQWVTIPGVGAIAVDRATGRPVTPGTMQNPLESAPTGSGGASEGQPSASTPQVTATGYAGGVAQALSAAGVPSPVVAGILGNGHHESGWNIRASGDGGTAHGAFQWRGERAANFQRITGAHPNRATPEQTARFVMWELQNPEAAGMTQQQARAILNARTPQQAALLFSRYYERPNARLANNERRAQLAANYAGGGIGAPATPRGARPSIQEQAASGVIRAERQPPEGMEWQADGSVAPIRGSQQEYQRGQDQANRGREAERDFAGLVREFRSDPAVRSWREARTATLQLQALGRSGSPADDIAAVFTFMKALDPQSAVRETEFATAQNAAGVPERIRNWYNQMRNGTRLSPDQRRELQQTAGRMYTQRSRTYNEAAESYRQQAVDMGVSPDRVGRMFQIANAPRSADRGRQGGQQAPVQIRVTRRRAAGSN